MECAVLINNCIKTFIIYYIKNIKNSLTKVKTEYRKQLIFSLDNRKIFITENILYNSLFKFLQINKNSKRYSVEIKNSSTWYKDIFNNLNSLIKVNQDIFSPIDSKLRNNYIFTFSFLKVYNLNLFFPSTFLHF